MAFQMIRPGVLSPAREQIRQDAIELMQTALGDCTAEYLSQQISSGQVDKDFIDRILECSKAHPGLVRIQKEDFIYAISQARPDCAPLFLTPAGDLWIDKACAELVKRLPIMLFHTIFGR